MTTSHSEPATMADVELLVEALEAASKAKQRHDERLCFLEEAVHKIAENSLKKARVVKEIDDRLNNLIVELKAEQQNTLNSFDSVRSDMEQIVQILRAEIKMNS